MVALSAGRMGTLEFAGLTWGQGCELKDVAFGIKKIVMSCVIKMDVVMDHSLHSSDNLALDLWAFTTSLSKLEKEIKFKA